LRRFQLSLVDAGSSPIVLNATLTGLKFSLEVTLDRAALAQKLMPCSSSWPRMFPKLMISPSCGRDGTPLYVS